MAANVQPASWSIHMSCTHVPTHAAKVQAKQQSTIWWIAVWCEVGGLGGHLGSGRSCFSRGRWRRFSWRFLRELLVPKTGSRQHPCLLEDRRLTEGDKLLGRRSWVPAEPSLALRRIVDPSTLEENLVGCCVSAPVFQLRTSVKNIRSRTNQQDDCCLVFGG